MKAIDISDALMQRRNYYTTMVAKMNRQVIKYD